MTNVSVGPASVAGFVTALSGFAAALISYLVVDPGQQQLLGTVVSAGIGVLALIVTQIGRYGQAKTVVAPVAVVPVVAVPTPAVLPSDAQEIATPPPAA